MSAIQDAESGELWTMYLGDCLKIMPTINKVDHVITDPPYETEAHTKGRRCRGRVLPNGMRELVPAAIDFAPMDVATRQGFAREVARVCRRWCLTFCQLEGAHRWYEEYQAAGLTYRRTGVWTKPDGQPQLTGDRPGVGYETIVMVHPSGRSRWNGGGRLATFDCNKKDPATPYGKPNEHPTQKPVPLFRELVALFTDPGETVLDAFAGSGTTGVACLLLGRRFIGIEKDPKYFDLACERLRAEEAGSTLEAQRAGQAALFGGGR